jgi:hypothetical protein
LAAELLWAFAQVPLEAAWVPGQPELSWSATLVVPPGEDPQHPPCFHALVRALDAALPELLSAALGTPLRRVRPGHLQLWSFRKGGYADAAPPLAPQPGGVDALLGLTAGAWPASWGGHPAPCEGPPGMDTLDLRQGGPMGVPLVRRPVHALFVRAGYAPC